MEAKNGATGIRCDRELHQGTKATMNTIERSKSSTLAIPLLLTLALIIGALAAPARAEMVSLFCSNRDLRYSYFIDIDYAGSTVSIRMDVQGMPWNTHRARISQSQIAWAVWDPLGKRWDDRRLNRINGEYVSCDKDEGCSVRSCQLANTVKPKF